MFSGLSEPLILFKLGDDLFDGTDVSKFFCSFSILVSLLSVPAIFFSNFSLVIISGRIKQFDLVKKYFLCVVPLLNCVWYQERVSWTQSGTPVFRLKYGIVFLSEYQDILFLGGH